MSRAIHGASARQESGEPSFSIGRAANRQNVVGKEALSRLPKLDIGELRQQWRGLYKMEASRHLSRELLVRAVAYRIQEVALGGLRPEPQRHLRRIAQEFKDTGEATIRARPELKPGTRLLREWQGAAPTPGGATGVSFSESSHQQGDAGSTFTSPDWADLPAYLAASSGTTERKRSVKAPS